MRFTAEVRLDGLCERGLGNTGMMCIAHHCTKDNKGWRVLVHISILLLICKCLNFDVTMFAGSYVVLGPFSLAWLDHPSI